MTWPPADHPVWKLAQGAISLVGLVIIVWHLHTHDHPGVDSTDVVGGGLAVKFAGEIISWKKRDT